jgi:hypothetical protein
MARKKGRKTSYDKLKEIDPNFIEVTMGLQQDGLKNKIVDLTKYQMEILDAKKNDLDLQRIVEQKSVAEEVYKTSLGAIKLKLNFLVELLKEKGS